MCTQATDAGAASDPAPTVFTAVEKHLGLKLESATRSFSQLIIHSIEREATENGVSEPSKSPACFCCQTSEYIAAAVMDGDFVAKDPPFYLDGDFIKLPHLTHSFDIDAGKR